MAETAEQILHEIETRRESLGASLDTLESRVKQQTDWRTHFARNPAPILYGALGAGVLLGLWLVPRRKPYATYHWA